ncbi:hypothetical protein QSH57_001533 [Fusarium oxysporum f. sp. vasinfectum]|nr:hypothetical protein QSH57_001533 [Fusarium oxysporum f. sp. vasinfectum]
MQCMGLRVVYRNVAGTVGIKVRTGQQHRHKAKSVSHSRPQM